MDGCSTVKGVDGREDASLRRNLQVCVHVYVLYAHKVHIVPLCIRHHWEDAMQHTVTLTITSFWAHGDGLSCTENRQKLS